MRMKKLMILAVAAIALVACSKTFDTGVRTNEGKAIGFGTWAEQLTKAARVPGTSTFTASGYQDNDFAVYGYKYKTSKTTVFDDVVVSTTDGSSWTYSPLKFWDSNFDKYVFYAVSPASFGTEGTVDPQTGAITTASITFTGNDNDLLIANEKTVLKTAGSGNFDSFATVPLVFNHAAALVDVYVKKAPSLSADVVKISAMTIGNVYTAGTLNVNTYVDGVPTIALANWTPATSGSYLPANGVAPVYGDNGSSAIAADNKKTISSTDTTFDPENTTPDTTPAAATLLFNNLVVVPQSFVAPTDRANPADASNAPAQKITISYYIGDTDFANRTIWLSDFDSIDDASQAATYVGSWEPGKHYSLYITILANAIQFSATIEDWADVNGYHYLFN